jgi:cell division protein FtsI (penicillin-binding protein 3)
MLDAFGFGHVSGSGYPGEAAGMLAPPAQWHTLEHATISYGYGLSVTPLQLAHAYSVLGAYGIDRPISLRRIDAPVSGQRVIQEPVARELLSMMEHVVTQEGATGGRAALDGYRVAGKTGTAWTAVNGTYDSDHFRATFGGVVPASHPKLAALVMIDDPAGTYHTGGMVSAPVFANVMAAALRLLGVPADNIESIPESRRDRALWEADATTGAPIARESARTASLKPVAGAQVRANTR